MELNNVKDMYQNLKELCEEKKFYNSLEALPFARSVHEGTYRRGNGQPYIIHPLFIACYLIDMGIVEDEAIAIALLHDTLEEDETCTLDSLNITDEIKRSVDLLTFRQGNLEKKEAQEIYMDRILYEGNAFTNLVKDIDRFHNLSTIPGAFNKEKMFSYTEETKRLFYPRFPIQQVKYSDYEKQLILLKTEISTIVDLAENIWNIPDNSKNKDKKLIRRKIFNKVANF